MRAALTGFGWLGVALGLYCFLGLHRSADALGMGLPLLGLVAGIGALAARGGLSRAGLTLFALVGIGAAAWLYLPQEAGPVRVYAKNLLWSNPRIEDVARDIRESHADLVLLQEVSTRNRAIMTMLAPAYPHQHICPFSGWSGIAVLSRHPFAGEGRCSGVRAMAAAPVEIGGTRVWAVSVHIHWPWPTETARAEAAARALLDGLDAPVILGGDFNAFPWSGRVARLVRRVDARLAGPPRITLRPRGVPLWLDSIAGPHGGAATRRPRLGGDHWGVLAEMRLTP